MKDLEDIGLNSNKLTSIPRDVFTGLTNLQLLLLQNRLEEHFKKIDRKMVLLDIVKNLDVAVLVLSLNNNKR